MHNTEIKYSRLSLIRFSRGKIIYLNEREIGIIESRSNSNYWLKSYLKIELQREKLERSKSDKNDCRSINDIFSVDKKWKIYWKIDQYLILCSRCEPFPRTMCHHKVLSGDRHQRS